jgi:crotonobetainyl-CoA:carnitine CoA-transferase CaiB-like acyl-CoA transferase
VPGVGEHTDAVLSDLLGVKADELQALRKAGVFGAISKVG